MKRHYVLDASGTPRLEPDIRKWALWYEASTRTLELDTLESGVTVSTVFLGSDHNFRDDGPPILWETMAFESNYKELPGHTRRYTSATEARLGHREVCDDLDSGMTAVVLPIPKKLLRAATKYCDTHKLKLEDVVASAVGDFIEPAP